MGKGYNRENLPFIVNGMLLCQNAESEVEAMRIAAKYVLPLEMIPTKFRSSNVWETMIPNMGITAIIRNCASMSKDHKMTSAMRRMIVEALNDEERLKKGRVHPFKMYVAYCTYSQGSGVRSDSTWTVDREIRNSLESAIYKCFKYGEPTGKKWIIGMDCSGSMTTHAFNNIPGMTPLDGEIVITLALLEAGDEVDVYRFDNQIKPARLHTGMTIDQARNEIYRGQFGSTNVGLLYEQAMKNRVFGGEPYDMFVAITDNEVNTGYQPVSLLKQYRDKHNANAKQVVLGMTRTTLSLWISAECRQMSRV
jgi:60 kDa SS-A/Ro ribonucleoprotein